MSDDFGGDLDAGHQDYDLNALHAEQGSDSDQFTNFDQFSENHAQEEDVHFQNFHNVEASDGHGATFSETDMTEFDAHSASVDSVNAESFTNIENQTDFSELDKLQESFESDFLHADGPGPQLGDGGEQQITAVSN